MGDVARAEMDHNRQSIVSETGDGLADLTPDGTPEPDDGSQSPATYDRKKEANRRAAIKSRQKKMAQMEAQRITMKALEEDNEALRREIRIVLHASGAAGYTGGQEGHGEQQQGRQEHSEDEYSLPQHSFGHYHPFGDHGGEGEGVEGLLGLGAGLGELANVAAAADQHSGYTPFSGQHSQPLVSRETLMNITRTNHSTLSTPTELAAAALRKSIQTHRTALESSSDPAKEQDVLEQIESVKVATAQRDKELSVLSGVLHRMTAARQQTESELEELRIKLALLIEEMAATEGGAARHAHETEDVRRALKDVRTYVESLVKAWKENGSVPPPPITMVPFLPPLPTLSGNATFTHAHLGNIPLPSSLPKRRGRPSKSRPSPALLPDSLRHLVPLPDQVRARDDIVPIPKRRKLRDDEMRGRPREFGQSLQLPTQQSIAASASAIETQPAISEEAEGTPLHDESQTLQLLEGLARARQEEQGHRPAGDQPLTLEQAAAAFHQDNPISELDLTELDDVISGRRPSKRSAASMTGEGNAQRSKH